MRESLVDSVSRVHVEVDFGLKTSINLVASADKIDGSDWGVMGNLFRIDGTPSNITLISLPQNWVKRLVDIEIYYTIAQPEGHNPFKSIQRIVVCGRLKELRSIRATICQLL